MKSRIYSLMLAAALLCAAVVAGCTTAHAQGDIPLTSANTCHYYDPAQSGQGFDLRITDATETAPASVFGTLYLGAIPQYYRYASTWFTVQGVFGEGDGNSQTFPVGDVFGVTLGQPGSGTLIEYGQIRITASSATTIAAELVLDGRGDSNTSPNLPIVVPFAFRCLVR